MSDGGFIDMRIHDNRRRVALTVLRARLKNSLHFKRTDRVALDSARRWAETKFATSKQALAWVEEQLEGYKLRDAAVYQARQYWERIANLSPETQTEQLFDALTHAFLTGWEPPSDPDNPETARD